MALVVLFLAIGCKDDEPAVATVDQGPAKEKIPDMGVVEVPVPPIELLRRLPKAPPGILALPGQPATALKDKKSDFVHPDTVTSGWLRPRMMVHTRWFITNCRGMESGLMLYWRPFMKATE